MSSFVDRLKASFISALVAALFVYAYLLVSLLWSGTTEFIFIGITGFLIPATVIFLVSLVISYLILFFLSPLCHCCSPRVSLIIFLAVGAIAGAGAMLAFCFAMPRFADEAMKTYIGIARLLFPYSLAGSVSALGAWFALMKYKKENMELSRG